MDLQYNQRKLN